MLARFNDEGDCAIMWVLISKDFCVVQRGSAYFVCRRVWNGKLECLRECDSYQEAYSAYRSFNAN